MNTSPSSNARSSYFHARILSNSLNKILCPYLRPLGRFEDKMSWRVRKIWWERLFSICDRKKHFDTIITGSNTDYYIASNGSYLRSVDMYADAWIFEIFQYDIRFITWLIFHNDILKELKKDFLENTRIHVKNQWDALAEYLIITIFWGRALWVEKWMNHRNAMVLTTVCFLLLGFFQNEIYSIWAI